MAGSYAHEQVPKVKASCPEPTRLPIGDLNARFEEASPSAVIEWAWQMFGSSACMTSSFQTQSVPLLHLVSRHARGLPVLFLDTGFHFQETLAFKDRLAKRLGLEVESVTSSMAHDDFLTTHGELYRKDPDLCCYTNKVAPLQVALEPYQAWISGVRRDQTNHRRHTPVIQLTEENKLKIAPMVHWTQHDIDAYILEHRLPEHPLTPSGYKSIGCAPCTRRPIGDDQRSGRWAGMEKTECGIHTRLINPGNGKKDDT